MLGWLYNDREGCWGGYIMIEGCWGGYIMIERDAGVAI